MRSRALSSLRRRPRGKALVCWASSACLGKPLPAFPWQDLMFALSARLFSAPSPAYSAAMRQGFPLGPAMPPLLALRQIAVVASAVAALAAVPSLLRAQALHRE